MALNTPLFPNKERVLILEHKAYYDLTPEYAQLIEQIAEFNKQNNFKFREILAEHNPYAKMLKTEGKHRKAHDLFDLLDYTIQNKPTIFIVDEIEFPKHNSDFMSRFLFEFTQVLMKYPNNYLIIYLGNNKNSYVHQFIEVYFSHHKPALKI